MSWIWWTTFIISAVATTLLQIFWCFQTSRGSFLASSVVSLTATAASLFSAIWMLVVWKNAIFCEPFTFSYEARREFYNSSYCDEGQWAAIAIINTTLWLAASGCMLYFVYSGRHAKWEKQLNTKSSSDDGDDDNNQGNNRTKNSCGSSTDGGCKVLCCPYHDAFVITAQIVSIFAFLISWFWWVTFFVSTTALILVQIIWCCQESRGAFLATSVVSSVAAITCLFAGIWMLVVWRDANFCLPFLWFVEIDDDDYSNYHDDYSNYHDDYVYSPDYCNEGAWASVAFVDTALWLTVNACMLYFVYGGRHAKWERVWNERNDDDNNDDDDNNNGRDSGPAAAVAEVAALEGASVDAIPLEEDTKAVLANANANANSLPPAVAVAVSTTGSV